MAVYLVYVGLRGHAFIDRELYLPSSWTDDRDRCAAARVPDNVGFATKPALARAMVARAVQAGVPARRFTGDEVYGNDPHLRADLRSQELGYVVAVARSHRVNARIGTRRTVDLTMRPDLAWARLNAGSGAHGHRLYD